MSDSERPDRARTRSSDRLRQQRERSRSRSALSPQSSTTQADAADARFDAENLGVVRGEGEGEMDPEQERWRVYQQQLQSSAAKVESELELKRPSGGDVVTDAAPSVEATKISEPVTFHELTTAASALQYEPAPLDLTSYPIDWFVKDSVPSPLTCPVCYNVVFDPPNLETCGQATEELAQARVRSASLRVNRVCMRRRRYSCGTPHSLLRSSVSSCHLSRLSQRMSQAQGGMSRRSRPSSPQRWKECRYRCMAR
jgi:hypothetical protein